MHDIIYVIGAYLTHATIEAGAGLTFISLKAAVFTLKASGTSTLVLIRILVDTTSSIEARLKMAAGIQICAKEVSCVTNFHVL